MSYHKSYHKIASISLILVLLVYGCGALMKTTEKIGMGVSLIKSPITISVFNVNKPLSNRDRQAILDVSSAIDSGCGDRFEAMKNAQNKLK